jgi:hypothetical protein
MLALSVLSLAGVATILEAVLSALTAQLAGQQRPLPEFERMPRSAVSGL